MNINIGDTIFVEKPTVYGESIYNQKVGGTPSCHKFHGVVKKINGKFITIDCGTMSTNVRREHVVKVSSSK